ncbi:hypothetical protein ACLOJK_035890 [Asimina triloba]
MSNGPPIQQSHSALQLTTSNGIGNNGRDHSFSSPRQRLAWSSRHPGRSNSSQPTAFTIPGAGRSEFHSVFCGLKGLGRPFRVPHFHPIPREFRIGRALAKRLGTQCREETPSALCSSNETDTGAAGNRERDGAGKIERQTEMEPGAAGKRERGNVRHHTIAYDSRTAVVEDTLDEFASDIHSPRSSGCKGSMLRIISFPIKTYYKHQLATRLQEINKEFHRVSELKGPYGLEKIEEEEVHDASEGWQRSVETAMLKKDDDIVGMKEEFDTIVK